MNVLVPRYSAFWCEPLLERADAVHLVVDDAQAGLSAEALAPFASVYRVTSLNSIEELSAVASDLLASGVTIDKVASAVEHTQHAAAYLAHLLGLGHPAPRVVANTRNKHLMKVQVAAAGVPVARHVSLRDVGPGIDTAELGFPLVLKPVSGWGAASTMCIDDADQLAVALADYRYAPELPSHQLVAEQFIEGDELHIDAVWRNSEPWVFVVSRYYLPPLRQWLDGGIDGSIVLHEDDHPELYTDLRTLQEQVNQAVGITRGATHMEVFVERGTERLVFSEIASRMGGGYIPALLGAHGGVHGRDLWAHELLDGAWHDLAPAPRRFPYVGAVNIAPTGSGTIAELPTREAVLAHQNVLDVSIVAGVGDQVCTEQRLRLAVMVVFGATSAVEVERVGEALASTFPVRVGATR